MSSAVRTLLLLSLGIALPACAAEPAGGLSQTATPALETEDQKTLYMLGQILGQNITNANLSEDEIAFVQMGLGDGALGRESLVEPDQYGPLVQVFMQQRLQAAAAEEMSESRAFLEAEAAVAGAVRTDSGLVLQEITPGSGESPASDATVTVHYHGTLRDGTVFDSSVDRGEPATFPLGQVIPCWTEGVQRIQVGGKTRLVCPPELAYGESPPPGIPGNAALVFEVELLEIVE
jgi:FKBP-type peptidyl-prolyl cis-trans isomerase FkpA